MSWPLYLIAACAAPLYLKLFGSGYSVGGVPVVVTMAIAMMLAIASGPLDTLLLMAGKSAASLAIMLVSLGVDVGVNLAFLPHLGIFVAALAWGLAVVVRNVLAFWQLRRVMAVTPLSRAATIAIIASLVCYAGPLLGVDALGVLDVGSFVVAVGLGSLLYVGALWICRDTLELTALRSLLPAKWAGGRG